MVTNSDLKFLFYLFQVLVFGALFLNSAKAQEVFCKEDFLKMAFEDVPRRKGLRFKNEVKETAQKIMGSITKNKNEICQDQKNT